MGLALALACASAACGDKDHYPPGGGGGVGAGGGSDRIDAGAPDAAVDAAQPVDAAIGILAGQLCNATDLRQPLACAAADMSGIDVVDVSSETSDLTDASGTFDLEVALRGNLTLRTGASDGAVRDALIPVAMWDGAGVRAPSIAQQAWDDLRDAISGTEAEGTASIVLYVRDGDGDPVAGADVIQPEGANPPYFDGAAADEWNLGTDTGAAGAAIVLSVPADTGTAQLSVVTGAGAPVDVIVPVEPGFLTWATVTVP